MWWCIDGSGKHLYSPFLWAKSFFIPPSPSPLQPNYHSFNKIEMVYYNFYPLLELGENFVWEVIWRLEPKAFNWVQLTRRCIFAMVSPDMPIDIQIAGLFQAVLYLLVLVFKQVLHNPYVPKWMVAFLPAKIQHREEEDYSSLCVICFIRFWWYCP